MSILKVSRLGHPVLREQASDIEVVDIRKGKFRQLVKDMFETMEAYQGVGLAGPQVHLPLRIFVFGFDEGSAKRRGADQPASGVFFNATLEYPSDEKITAWEGCLSVPFLGGQVPRHKTVILRGLNAKGEPATVEISGFLARIFQHEVDHTDGHIYLDRMPDLRTLGYTMVL
jgi:peptide deformylase